MNRVKTFDATGIAPNGRLYAGDLNSIQDASAGLTDLAQTIALGSIQVGETGLQIVRFGAGEMRVTGALRIDGILRSTGGGLLPPSFTTAGRNAIGSGLRPTGMIIYNTDNSRLEINIGTDASPSWQAVYDTTSAVTIGSTQDWPWAAASIPSNYLLCYGQAISRTTYAALAAIASASAYPWGNGDGSTTFNLPDYRGRVGVGKDDMGGTAANRVTAGGSGLNGASLGAGGGVEIVTLTSGQIPAHNHAITGSPSRTGSASLAGAVGYSDPGHYHPLAIETGGGGSDRVISLGAGAGSWGYMAGLGVQICQAVGTGITVNNGSLSVSDTIGVNAGSLGTSNTGSGGAHSNVQPSIIVNKIMRVL